MNPTPDEQTKLEHLVHRALRALPERTAPATLEQRVRSAIAGRAALPWWRRGFAHWPVPARVAFVPLAGGIAAFVLLLTTQITASVDTAALGDGLAQPLAWVESIRMIAEAIANFCAILIRNIPPLWLYGGLAFCAAMYAALFGLGAAAYRTFHTQR
jgi:hypothetical protein